MQKQAQQNSLESLVWSITWIKAFPTLYVTQWYGQDHGLVWQQLAFDTIFEDHSLLSYDKEWKYMRDNKSMANSLGYGEIAPHAVAHIIERMLSKHQLNLDHTSVVIDLGSGNGRVLMAARLAHPFAKAIGVEIVPELHREAMNNLERWKRCDASDLSFGCFDFQCADFTRDAPPMASAKIVFVHATVFNEQLMVEVQIMCESCARGTFFVMVSKPLREHRGIRTVEVIQLDMNWGQATVFVQEKYL